MYATHRGITINASIVSTMLTNLGTPQATPEYITTAQLDRGIGNINRSYRSTVRTFLVKNGLMEAKRAMHGDRRRNVYTALAVVDREAS